MREKAPYTEAEKQQIRIDQLTQELGRWRNAVGTLAVLTPAIVVDPDDPASMARQMVAAIVAERAARPTGINALRLRAEHAHPTAVHVYGVEQLNGGKESAEIEIACSAFRMEHDYNEHHAPDGGFGPLYAWIRVRLADAVIGLPVATFESDETVFTHDDRPDMRTFGDGDGGAQ